jgi:uncharacterized protein (TIGR03118 family)
MPTATAGAFKSTILVSDGSVAAPHVDPNLQNSWGIAFGPTTPVWVSDNNTQKSSLYDGNGAVQSLVVTLPPAASGQPASPTGIVFNSTKDFAVTANGATGNAAFIFATLAGTIAAWSPKVLPTQAVTVHTTVCTTRPRKNYTKKPTTIPAQFASKGQLRWKIPPSGGNAEYRYPMRRRAPRLTCLPC